MGQTLEYLGRVNPWNSGGKNYEAISQSFADAIEHCVTRLAPKKDQRVLDVATGTGWAARRAAARGAKLTGIDLGIDLIAAAKALAHDNWLWIDFLAGDAEALPFADASFDAVLSTFGVIFAARPQIAAAELARVCKKGGRLGLATWPGAGSVAGFVKVLQPYLPAPPQPAPPSPFDWGDRQKLQQLLGGAFDLKFETGTTVLREVSGAAIWDWVLAGHGPTKTLAASLDAERLENLKKDFIAYHDGFKNDLGIAMPREYLVTIGVRK